jgi:hypothetical protein
MNGGLVLALIIFVAAGVVILTCSAVVRRRSQGLSSWAAANQWQYVARDNSYTQMPLGFPFGVGYNHSSYDVLTGTAHGYPATCFTYHYDMNRTVQAGQTREGRYFTVWLLTLPKQLPPIRVRHGGIASAVLHPSDMPAIDIGGAQFQREYQVSADDPRFAATLLDARMEQFLLDNNRGGFEICGSDIVAVREGQLTQDAVLPELDYLAGVVARIPATFDV